MSKRLKQTRQRGSCGDPTAPPEDRGDVNRRRSKTVFGRIKNKLSRQRSASNTDPHPLLLEGKSATLPARVRSAYPIHTRPRSGHELLEGSEELLPSSNPSRASDEDSVDSGLDRDPRNLDGSESDSSPKQQKLPCSLYDEVAVQRAFGPAMKDIGRWYSTHQQRYLAKEQHHHCKKELLDAAEQERLASRPPLPLPHERTLLVASKKVSQDSVLAELEEGDAISAEVYDKVLPRLLGTNGLMLGLRDLARHGWYWGPLTRVEAEEKLSGCNDGTFLVRDSSDDRYLLSLSFRSQGKTLHTRIEYSNGFFSFYSFPDSENEGYRSVVELIERSMRYSSVGVFCFSRARAMGSPAVPVRLLKPLSRFFHVRSLQHYCRFVIRQSIRFDAIRRLPLPKHVHNYLEQSQY